MNGNQLEETVAPYPQFTFGGVLMGMVVGQVLTYRVTDDELDHAKWMTMRTHQNSIRRFHVADAGAGVARVERLPDHEKVDGRAMRQGEFDFRIMEIQAGAHIDIEAPMAKHSGIRKTVARIASRYKGRRLICNLIEPGVLRVKRLAEGQDGESDAGPDAPQTIYPFMQLEVGETANVPAPCNISSIRASANYHKRRYQRAFQVRSLEGGRAEIKRVA